MDRTRDGQSANHIELSDSEIVRRKRFLEFGTEDVERLTKAHELARVYADEVIEEFYQHLLACEVTREFFVDPELLAHVKARQKDYFLRLTRGNYERDYVEDRLKIGAVHERIGLPVDSYLGMYNFYLRAVANRIFDALADQPETALATFLSLTKLTFLDMGLAIETYIDQRERTILEHQRVVEQERALRLAQEAVGREKDELVSIVSHELRTPLVSLVGFTELMLARDFSEPERREFLGIMLEEGRRLTALINDFLDLQRFESGAQRIVPTPNEVMPLLRRAIAAAGENPEHPVVLEDGDELPPVRADADRVLHVLSNLLSNARKYSPTGGEIRIAARVVDGAVEIAVQDRGLGIPQDALPQIFERFYRVDNSDRREISGTGLGLAICQQIIAGHGGRIWAESAGLGEGATFRFTLPLAIGAVPTGDVLVIDDDRGFGRLLEAELAALGLSAALVQTAEEALARFVEEKPRAVILDLLLPTLQGEDLLGRLNGSRSPVVPVVVITVKDLSLAQRLDLDRLGVVAVFQKGPGMAAQAARAVHGRLTGSNRDGRC